MLCSYQLLWQLFGIVIPSLHFETMYLLLHFFFSAHPLLKIGSGKYRFATAGLQMAVMVSVVQANLNYSVLLLDHTQKSIEMTLMADLVVVRCRGGWLPPQIPRFGSVKCSCATNGQLMELRGSVVVVYQTYFAPTPMNGPPTTGMTPMVVEEGAKWLGNSQLRINITFDTEMLQTLQLVELRIYSD